VFLKFLRFELPDVPARGSGPSTRPGARERSLGLGFYLSGTDGAGGALRSRVEDFAVFELSRYPRPQPDGRHVVVRLRAVDIEQNALVARLQGALHLRPGSVGFAGTKDRRAVTEQLFSFPWPPGALPEITLSGVTLLEAYRARDPVTLGSHYGNRFSIVVRDPRAPPQELSALLGATEEELRSAGGFPNFFGPQRFGEVRPMTHVVGEALLQGDPQQAVERYLDWVDPLSPEPLDGARRRFAETHDVAAALREFPPAFRFERALLDALGRGRSGEGALRALPRNLRMLFVHAYQSWLFNRLLTLRQERALPLGEPVAGDRVVRLAPDGLDPGDPPVPVEQENLPEAQAWVRSGRARVVGPLVGYETPELTGQPGELLELVLEEAGIDRAAFRLPAAPDLASRGTFRAFLAPFPALLAPSGAPRTFRVGEEGRSVRFDFSLEKGQYATVLLREFLKADSS
jgi:tRNA pseudouridine13 synthase